MKKFFAKITRGLKSFANKRLTFHLSFNSPAKPFSLHISFLTILVVMTSMVLFFTSIFLIWGGYAQRATTKAYLEFLQFTDETCESQLCTLSEELTQLKSSMEEISCFSGDMCELYDIEEIDPQTRELGMGGEIIGADADLMRDTRISDLSITYQELLLEFERQNEILSNAQGQSRIWQYTPTIKPCGGPIISGFGWRRNPLGGGVQMHKGIDIAMPQGAPIVAPADGTITFAGAKTGYGMVIILDHKYGFQTRYGHCSQLLVAEGDEVVRGDLIALVGSTGWATGAHLHYEVLVNSVRIDPMRHILPEYIED